MGNLLAPPFIIFSNTDLSDQVQSVVVRQLFITQVMTGAIFDGYVAADPNYPSEIHADGYRILVLRPLYDYTNRNLADIVLFFKNGLVSVEFSDFGPPGATFTIDRCVLSALITFGKIPPWCDECRHRHSHCREREGGGFPCQFRPHPPCPLPPPPAPPAPIFPPPIINANYLQGIPVAPTKPTTNQILEFNGSTWVPADNSGGGGGTNFVAGQDLSGTATAQTVIGLQDHPLATTSPTNSAVPVWDSTVYDIRQLTMDDILPGFSITGFSGGGTIELGGTFPNPAFTASYSSLPTSAQITNTDSIDSPLILTTPFTSGTVIGNFQHNTATSVTFTLTAVASSTKTATSSISWEARSFGGVGAAGAVSATASGVTAILNTSDVLSNLGLHGSDVGQSYGTFSPIGQKIYLLLIHTGSPHSFRDQNNFTFAFNAPTTIVFTNQTGANLFMDLYESTNLLSTPFTISVVS